MDYQKMNNEQNQDNNDLTYLSDKIYKVNNAKNNIQKTNSKKQKRQIIYENNLRAYFQQGQKNGSYDFTIVGRAFSQLNNLWVLNLIILRKVSICSQGLKSLSKGLSKLSNLQIFTFSLSTDNIIGENAFEDLSDSIKQMNNLNALNLKIYDIKIPSTSFEYITNCVTSINSLTKLSLNLIKNDLSNESIKYFGVSIGQMNQLQHLKIHINNQNGIEIEAKQSIQEGISKLQGLIYLNLKIKEIIECANKEQLKIFSNHNNDFGNLLSLDIENKFSNEIIERIKSQQLLKNLQQLNITFLKFFSIQELTEITQSLQHFLNLYYLNIHFHKDYFKQKDVVMIFQQLSALQLGLKECKNLISLRIRTNTDYDHQFIRVAHGLQYLIYLQLFKGFCLTFQRDHFQQITNLSINYVQIRKLLKQKEWIAISEEISKLPQIRQINLQIQYFKQLKVKRVKKKIIEINLQQDDTEKLFQFISIFLKNKLITTLEIDFQQEEKYKQSLQIIRQSQENYFSVDIDTQINSGKEEIAKIFWYSVLKVIFKKYTLQISKIVIVVNNCNNINRDLLTFFKQALQQLLDLTQAEVQFKEIQSHDQFILQNEDVQKIFLGLTSLYFLQYKCFQDTIILNKKYFQEFYRKNIRLVVIK